MRRKLRTRQPGRKKPRKRRDLKRELQSLACSIIMIRAKVAEPRVRIVELVKEESRGMPKDANEGLLMERAWFGKLCQKGFNEGGNP